MELKSFFFKTRYCWTVALNHLNLLSFYDFFFALILFLVRYISCNFLCTWFAHFVLFSDISITYNKEMNKLLSRRFPSQTDIGPGKSRK